MIAWTDEENEIFRKVNLGYRQIDICNFLDFKIFHLTTFLQENPHDSNARKKLKELIRFQQDIQTINDYKEMEVYEKKLDAAYWNPKYFEGAINDFIKNMKGRNNQ